MSYSTYVHNYIIINQCQFRRAEQSLHFASIPTNFFIFIILRPRPRTYASASPLLLLQLHQQQQLLSIITIINSTNHHLQHAKLRILLQHLTSHAAYERRLGGREAPLYVIHTYTHTWCCRGTANLSPRDPSQDVAT